MKNKTLPIIIFSLLPYLVINAIIFDIWTSFISSSYDWLVYLGLVCLYVQVVGNYLLLKFTYKKFTENESKNNAPNS